MLKKETKRGVISVIAPPLASFLLKFIYFTCKVRFHGSDFPHENAIYASWHGEMVMTPFCYLKMQTIKRSICVITSRHFDGRMIGEVLKKIVKGGKSVEGSSSKGGSKSLRVAMKILKDGDDLAIAPDGPRGPRHSVAQGIVILSQRMNVPIVVLNCKASSSWRFKSWDRMFLPKPFSRIDFFVSEPFYLDGLDVKEGRKKVKDMLMENADV